jgi:asparagine synthetase B (glutamine-hydrolysing)
MCGIAGKLYFDSGRHTTRQELVVMSQTLRHRGPDGEGVWVHYRLTRSRFSAYVQ